MQKVMRHVFGGLPQTAMYIDDIGQGASTVSESLKLLKEAPALPPNHQDPISSTRAILGLDLKKVFDNEAQAAILSRINKLNLGERSNNNTKNFLSCRMVTLKSPA